MQRRLLRKEEIGAIQRKIAIYLVRRYLMIAFDAIFAARVEQDARADDIRLKENLGRLNRAIHMRLRREVHDHIGFLTRKECIDRRAVGNVAAHKGELRGLPCLSKGRDIPRIGQSVIADDLILRMLTQFIVDKIGADKSCAARNDHLHS